MEQRVVIAGGGPVGLWLAAELRLGGVSVTVVEERIDIDQRSKALTIHPRTLETLASRGVHKPFLAEGLPIPGGHFAMLDDRLDFRALETPFPYTSPCPRPAPRNYWRSTRSRSAPRSCAVTVSPGSPRTRSR